MTTKTKMLSTESDSSSRYAAKYSVAALLPCVAATHSPTASPSPTHTMTHAIFRDEEPRASVPGRCAAGRSGSGVVLTIGRHVDDILVLEAGSHPPLRRVSACKKVSNVAGRFRRLSGEAQKHVMRVPGSLASTDLD